MDKNQGLLTPFCCVIITCKKTISIQITYLYITGKLLLLRWIIHVLNSGTLSWYLMRPTRGRYIQTCCSGWWNRHSLAGRPKESDHSKYGWKFRAYSLHKNVYYGYFFPYKLFHLFALILSFYVHADRDFDFALKYKVLSYFVVYNVIVIVLNIADLYIFVEILDTFIHQKNCNTCIYVHVNQTFL